jgi:filamentous hemagglutinin
MRIGGALDENGTPVGQTQAINNHSSTIESAGDMAIAASQINNINDNFSTEVVLVSQEQLTEYQHTGSTSRWKAGDEGSTVTLPMACATSTPRKRAATVTITSTSTTTPVPLKRRIKESDPAKILAGGNMTLAGDRLFNDKSQVVAGGTLLIDQLGSVQNDDVPGVRYTTDNGSVTHYYRIRHKGDDEQGAAAPHTLHRRRSRALR